MGMCVSRRNENPSNTDVEEEFKKGNFVVKGSGCRKFNQVDPDHSQEWLNGTGKTGGGTVGITKTTTALSRWTLSFNIRAQISAQTRQIYAQWRGRFNAIIHNEATPARIKKDNSDEGNIVKILEQFKVFAPVDGSTEYLHSIATKDVATPEIQEPLLSAEDSQSWTPLLKKGW